MNKPVWVSMKRASMVLWKSLVEVEVWWGFTSRRYLFSFFTCWLGVRSSLSCECFFLGVLLFSLLSLVFCLPFPFPFPFPLPLSPSYIPTSQPFLPSMTPGDCIVSRRLSYSSQPSVLLHATSGLNNLTPVHPMTNSSLYRRRTSSVLCMFTKQHSYQIDNLGA